MPLKKNSIFNSARASRSDPAPWAAALLLLLLTACQEKQQAFHGKAYVFGTWVNITLHGVSRGQGQALMRQLEQKLNLQHQAWHAWRPGTLAEVNKKLRSGQAFHVEPSMERLIQLSKTAFTQSNGLFNPAAGRLFKRWGFHQEKPGTDAPPSTAELETFAAQGPNMDHIVFEADGKIRGLHQDLHLDFGGIAKGFSIDSITRQLKSHNIPAALINAGGDLRAYGQPEKGKPWVVAIRAPSSQDIVGTIALDKDESVVTSGTYEKKYHSKQGTVVHHIIDPRTAQPASGIRSVTVLHGNATLADAAATALLVAGEKDWREIAYNFGMRFVLLITDDHRLIMSKEMEQRLAINQSFKQEM